MDLGCRYAGAGKAHILRCGTQGAPVFFLPGNGGRASQWERQLAFLGERHQGVALDLRGLGASDAPWDGDFSVGGLADDVAAVADHFQLQRFFLVGHSLGASVAACFAGRFPYRLLGLILVDYGGDPRNNSPEELSSLMSGLAPANFEGFAKEAMETCLRGAKPQVAAQVLADLEATPRTSFAGAVLGLLDFDPVAALANDGGRKLHIYSPFLEELGLIPIHERVRGIESRGTPDCTHWVHLDCPDAFNETLLEFLES